MAVDFNPPEIALLRKTVLDSGRSGASNAVAAFDRLFQMFQNELLLCVRERMKPWHDDRTLVLKTREYALKRRKSWKKELTFPEFLIDCLDVVLTADTASSASNGNKDAIHDLYRIFPDRRVAIDACLLGDCDSLERLSEMYYDEPLRGAIRGHVGSGQVAKDIAHDTWEWFLRNRKSYNPIYPFRKFILQRARSLVLDYFRSAKKQRETLLLLREFPELESEGEINGPAVISQSVSPPDEPMKALEFHVERMALLYERIALLFHCGTEPHKTLIYPLHLEQKPQYIVEHFSSSLLNELYGIMEEKYLSVCDSLIDQLEVFAERLPEHAVMEYREQYRWFFEDYTAEVLSCSKPLSLTLERAVKDVYTRKHWEELRKNCGSQKVGSTLLGAYFGKSPEGDISNWCGRIKDRVREALEGKDIEGSMK